MVCNHSEGFRFCCSSTELQFSLNLPLPGFELVWRILRAFHILFKSCDNLSNRTRIITDRTRIKRPTCTDSCLNFITLAQLERIPMRLKWLSISSHSNWTESRAGREPLISIIMTILYLCIPIGHQCNVHDVHQQNPCGKQLHDKEASAARTQTLIVQADLHWSFTLAPVELNTLLLNLMR